MTEEMWRVTVFVIRNPKNELFKWFKPGFLLEFVLKVILAKKWTTAAFKGKCWKIAFSFFLAPEVQNRLKWVPSHAKDSSLIIFPHFCAQITSFPCKISVKNAKMAKFDDFWLFRPNFEGQWTFSFQIFWLKWYQGT